MMKETSKFQKLSGEIASYIEQGSFPHGILIECQNENDGEDLARFVANCLVCRGSKKALRSLQ